MRRISIEALLQSTDLNIKDVKKTFHKDFEDHLLNETDFPEIYRSVVKMIDDYLYGSHKRAHTIYSIYNAWVEKLPDVCQS